MAVAPTELSSYDELRGWHGFRAKASLSLTQQYITIPPSFVGFTLKCWSWVLLVYFCFSGSGKPSLDRYADVKLAINLWHPNGKYINGSTLYLSISFNCIFFKGVIMWLIDFMVCQPMLSYFMPNLLWKLSFSIQHQNVSSIIFNQVNTSYG